MKPEVTIDTDGKPRLANCGCVTYLDGAKTRAARITQGWPSTRSPRHSECRQLSFIGSNVAKDQRFLTFALVRDITTLLGATLDEMLVEAGTSVVPDEPDTIRPDDAATVGAALARSRHRR